MNLVYDNFLKLFRKLFHSSARNLQLYRIPAIWNLQYKIGRWKYIGTDRRRLVIELAEKHADHGSIVELACGEGTLIFSLDPDSYSSYLGIDISSEAIEVAIAKAEKLNYNNCKFNVGDMVGWIGDNQVSLIIFEECIFYIPAHQQRNILQTAYNSLKCGGVILLTFHSIEKHQNAIDNCLSLDFKSKVIEDGESLYILLFRN